ncbi:MAG: rod shape-determining protein MreC [Candidatus Adlerbacteria bacterium]|nr:rod shape-determining protein MreC [Candidatus Adlerbacteria bacterium]MDZ4226208.1 rod shape-determining protein MreC [Patescibacteria group bacterium]
MTTISHKRRSRGRGVRTLLVILLCVVVAAILVVWRGPLTGLFWTIFSPVFSGTQSFIHQNELERLRAELGAAQALVADRELLLRENIELKTRLGRVPEETSTLLAAILLRPPATPYDTLMLDVGLKEGVSVGDLVFSVGSVVIGKVTEVYRSTSRATLFSAPGEAHDVLVFTQGGSVPLVAEGQGSGSFIGKLPQGTQVNMGDPVLFPDIVPILMAQIAAVETAPNESFQTVYMQLPANPLLLHYVEVRKPSSQ